MQTVFHEKFVIDENGKRTAVIIDAKEYTKILRLLEEAQILKIIREGEQEYREGKLKPIQSLSDLDK
jgi:PHD/YefM family antitoxin component YafN of YafNO toxin-antitoxin module